MRCADLRHQGLLWRTAHILAGLLWVSAAWAQTYDVIDLGTLGGTQSGATGLNNSGQVVGWSKLVNDTVQHAFLWESGAISDLGALGGAGQFSLAAGINDSGQVVGVSALANGRARGFFWQNGAMSGLGTLGGPESNANGINQSGQVAGWAHTSLTTFGFFRVHAFAGQNGAMGDLGIPGGTDNFANGINNFGHVVGKVGIVSDFFGHNLVEHAFLWQDGTTTDLGTLGRTDSVATGINDSGQVVGYAASSSDARAFLWQNGVMSDLGTLGGTSSYAYGINNSGQVVGQADTASGARAFVWQNGVMKDLNDLIDPNSGWVLTRATAINNAGHIVGYGGHNGLVRAFLLRSGRRPVLVIPGVGATYAADPSNDLFWLTHRGVNPGELQIDPLSRSYHDLIQTFRNAGYLEFKDLFVVNYDWRLPPGPTDGVFDGRISGLTAASISAGNYLYAVDYLGKILREAAEQWELDHPGEPPLDAVDVITHSTGGLVARAYIQSDAYGGIYTGTKALPKINNLIMIGVPNRGASKAWNPLHDNWGVDPAFQMVLSKIINRAYQKVLIGTVISGPDYDISLDSISSPNCEDEMKICFIKQYVPTARALLATYDFIDFGSGFTNVNSDLAARNSLLLDLNAGLDHIGTGDPNAFADDVLAQVTVIYGTNGGAPLVPLPGQQSLTPTRAVKRFGPSPICPLSGCLPIVPFDDFVPHGAGLGDTYFSDIKDADSGDGTVPLESSIGQFLLDPRLNDQIILRPFTRNGNTPHSVDHTALPFNTTVQQAILGTLGVPCAAPCVISTNLNGLAPTALACAVNGCLNVIFDPVEGFVVDGLGRRLGFSAATGPVTEIPGSVWFGNTDGIGWIFGPMVEPLRLELTGLGEPYYVMVSALTPTGNGGLIDQGVLGAGVQRIVPVLFDTNAILSVTKAGSGLGTVTSDVGAVNCGAACSDTHANGTPITLTAVPLDAGHQFMGWLGPCTGVGTCQFTINGTTTAVATFALTAVGSPTVDVDGNDSYDALTDGLLVIRYLFGLTGAALIDGAVGPLATRTTDTAVVNYLTDIRPALDVDGNGHADALTDGLLIIRYLFGLRGAGLIGGAVGTGATRTSAADIEAWLAVLTPPE
ncbi:MAG: DUF3466 family protein [Betaproteobacteria bacterium]|nr:DUF3466 family protein [Betaproteobacteria bacterium]